MSSGRASPLHQSLSEWTNRRFPRPECSLFAEDSNRYAQSGQPVGANLLYKGVHSRLTETSPVNGIAAEGLYKGVHSRLTETVAFPCVISHELYKGVHSRLTETSPRRSWSR